jgi:hypothetical protein
VAGSTNVKNDAAVAAQTASVTAYSETNARAPHRAVVGDSAVRLSEPASTTLRRRAGPDRTLTLDAEGNPNAVFIFQTDGAMNTAASSNVLLINGASPPTSLAGRGRVGTGATPRSA